MASAPMHPVVGRSPLKAGNRYVYPGYPGAGFEVSHVCLPGHPEHDGGLPGVSVKWIGHKPGGMKKAFYMAKDEADFWQKRIFSNAFDPPNPKDHRDGEAVSGASSLLGGPNRSKDHVLGDKWNK